MNKPELETYRKTLDALRTRLKGDVSHLANEALHTTGGETSGAGRARSDRTGASARIA